MQQWLFVDGAGKPQPEQYVAYCGYLIENGAAEEFFSRWQKLLWDEFIPSLSMKECRNWRGEAWELKRRQWGEQADAKRQALLMSLADVVSDSRVFAFGHAVNTSACRAKQIEPTEYYLFVKLLESLFQLQGPQDLELIVVVDEEESAAERIYKFYRKLRLERKDLANQIKLIGIGDDRAIPGLQAADMLAYCTVAELKRRVSSPDSPPDELWVRLMKGVNQRALTHEWFVTDPAEFLKLAGIV